MKTCTIAGCPIEASVKFLSQFYCVRHAMDSGIPSFVVPFNKVDLNDLGYAELGKVHPYKYVVDGDRQWLIFQRED